MVVMECIGVDMNEKILKVCITDEKSIPYNAINSLELIEKIKEQIASKIEKTTNIGILGSNDCEIPLDRAAFTYENPQICDGKLYVDFKLLDTPCGKILQQLCDDNATYRSVSIGIGNITEDKCINNYDLISVNAILEEFKLY